MMLIVKSPRHLGRVIAVQAIFGYEFHQQSQENAFQVAIEGYENELSDPAFSRSLFFGAIEYLEKIRKIIQEFASDWPIEKIAPIDRAILEIALYELLFQKETPPIVVIDEAVEVAKNFGDVNSSKFVNGVLSSIMQKYCKERDPKTGIPYGTEISGTAEKDQNPIQGFNAP